MVSEEVAIRQVIERTIVTAVVEDALAAGYALQEDEDGITTQDKQDILELLFNLDDAYVHIISIENQDGDIVTNSVGWVRFVFGNDGWDVISDYSLNIEPLIQRALDMGDKISTGDFRIVVD
jgi:hypothetical protein